MDTKKRFKAFLYSPGGSLAEVTDDKPTRSQAVAEGKAWLSEQPIGASVEIAVEYNFAEYENVRSIKAVK